ncbi:hypothetical protein GCM10009624_20860 [Gordonia sinesedis]
MIVGKQGRLVVPADLRSELDLREGEALSIRRVGTTLVLERPEDAARTLRGFLADASAGRSLVEELLAERLAEVDGAR